MEIFWLIMIIFLGFIELITINLVTVWFVASAVVSFIISFFVESFYIQFAVFVVLGIIFLVTTRKKLTSWLDKSKQKTNYLDRIMDMEGVVTKEIAKNKAGQVKIDGKLWTAVSNKKIEVGKEITIKKIDGVRLVVEEVE